MWKTEGTLIALETPCVIDNRQIINASYSTGTLLDTVVIPAATLRADLASLRGAPSYKRLRFDPLVGFSAHDALAIIHIASALKVGLHGPSSMRDSPIAISCLRQALM